MKKLLIVALLTLSLFGLMFTLEINQNDINSIQLADGINGGGEGGW